MPLQEKRSFIQDPKPDMTTEEKNKHLSAKLSAAPYDKMQIIRIERAEDDGGAHGWWIIYSSE